ncbi:MAG: PIN domain-containing protein [Gammaproteobacteria bacterium]
MIAYIDSSVLLRLILGQRDKLKEWKTIKAGVASALVEVECLKTLDRLRLRAGISDEQLAVRRESVFRVLQEFEVVEPGTAVLSRASQPFPTPLGTLDAIHLATAILWRERGAADLVLATHDAALGIAGRACGFQVVGT